MARRARAAVVWSTGGVSLTLSLPFLIRAPHIPHRELKPVAPPLAAPLEHDRRGIRVAGDQFGRRIDNLDPYIPAPLYEDQERAVIEALGGERIAQSK